MTENILTVRAFEQFKRKIFYTFSFFLPGSKLISIANISRIKRDVDESLEGFQRKEIKNHVRGIVDYLDEGNVLFPNAVILALDTEHNLKPQGELSLKEMRLC